MLPFRARVDLGAMAMKGYSASSKSSSITKTSPSDCLVSYLGNWFWGGGLTPLQRSSRCILHPQPTGMTNFRYRIGDKVTERHQRKKWTWEENKNVFHCYFEKKKKILHEEGIEKEKLVAESARSNTTSQSVCMCVFGFYGISTFVCFLMLNPIFYK